MVNFLIIYWIVAGVFTFFLCRFYSQSPEEKWTWKDYVELGFLTLIGPLLLLSITLGGVCIGLTLIVEKILGREE